MFRINTMKCIITESKPPKYYLIFRRYEVPINTECPIDIPYKHFTYFALCLQTR